MKTDRLELRDNSAAQLEVTPSRLCTDVEHRQCLGHSATARLCTDVVEHRQCLGHSATARLCTDVVEHRQCLGHSATAVLKPLVRQ